MEQFKIKRLTIYAALLLSTLLIACNNPEQQKIPPLAKGSKAYFDLLASGDKTKINNVFFMPLHQKDIKHLVTHFNQAHEALKSGDLRIDMKAFHQQGRWGLITLNKTSKLGKKLHDSLWFFYYKKKWRVISPEIYYTKEVRAMMNLYPEFEELKKWLPTTKRTHSVVGS